MNTRIRARIFPKEPGCVLFYIPPGHQLNVKDLGELSIANVRTSCGDVQVSSDEAGRYTQAMIRARRAAKAEAGQKDLQHKSLHAALMRGSVDPEERDHAKLVQEKNEVDLKIRQLKSQIGKAKSRLATTGQHMNPAKFRSLEADLEAHKQKSQALQTQLGDLKEQRKQQNTKREMEFDKAFIRAAFSQLDKETFDSIKEAALEEAEALGMDDETTA